MSKQNLWFLTLFSLILVLSVYYITMPNDLLISNKKDEKVVSTKNEKTKIEETSSLVAMRVSLEEERQNEMDVLQELLTNEASSAEEKNKLHTNSVSDNVKPACLIPLVTLPTQPVHKKQKSAINNSSKTFFFITHNLPYSKNIP